MLSLASPYLNSNFTLRTVQSTVQNSILSDHMDELLDTVSLFSKELNVFT
jgi:hypothetical protein